jgi:hypothetical protein
VLETPLRQLGQAPQRTMQRSKAYASVLSCCSRQKCNLSATSVTFVARLDNRNSEAVGENTWHTSLRCTQRNRSSFARNFCQQSPRTNETTKSRRKNLANSAPTVPRNRKRLTCLDRDFTCTLRRDFFASFASSRTHFSEWRFGRFRSDVNRAQTRSLSRGGAGSFATARRSSSDVVSASNRFFELEI